jgi:hypothetical protein
MRRPVRFALRLAACVLVPLLAGCDQLGIESASAVAAKREAEGKAIGAGCRHAARSVEQCYALNRRADKAAVFAGWREMNDYMRENNLEAQPPAPEPPPTEVAAADPAEAKGGEGDDKGRGEAKGVGAKGDAKGDIKGKAEGPADAKAEAKSDAKAASRDAERAAPDARPKPRPAG